MNIVDTVLRCLRETASEHAVPLPETLGPETVLFGKDGLLDSMALVSLVVAVEQAVEDETGRSVALADDRALSQARSPYRSVGALADYADARLSGAPDDG